MKFILLSLALVMMAVSLAAEECAIMCSKIFQPICAGDSNTQTTFSNACMLDIYNCENPDKQLIQLRSGSC